MLTRRSVLGTAVGAVSMGLLAQPAGEGVGSKRGRKVKELKVILWHNVETWGVEGKGWGETLRYFDRFPARAEGKVPQRVWELSRESAGMLAGFESDATEVHVRYTLLSDNLQLPHMPATGVSGIDLYGKTEEGWRWAGVFKPSSQRNEGALLENADAGPREWRVYLPLYNGIETLEIGVPEGASFRGIAPRSEKPIVFYGTSILHGASASRPGMAWPSIVGRRLNVPTINLGFSGSGKMEPEVVGLIAELDARAFVIDCAPNMNAGLIKERAVPLVEMIRKARPEAGIVLVEDRRYGDGWIKRSRRELNEQNAKALREAYELLVSRAVGRLEYVSASTLMGADSGEYLTDGSHPNDMGMTRYADAISPVLQKLLS